MLIKDIQKTLYHDEECHAIVKKKEVRWQLDNCKVKSVIKCVALDVIHLVHGLNKILI